MLLQKLTHNDLHLLHAMVNLNRCMEGSIGALLPWHNLRCKNKTMLAMLEA